VTLTEDEKREFAEKFKADLAEKYRQRALESALPKRERAMASTADPEAERDAEFAKLRLELLDEFHKANHFVRHIDSRGHERWLSADEYERMQNRRRRKKRAIYEPIWGGSMKRTALLGIGLVLAAVLGWFLAE
jgi:hypothetical protein